MDIHSLKFGDIVHSSDDTLIKVHHIGKNGEVYYMAYADAARGRLQKEPYTFFMDIFLFAIKLQKMKRNGLKIGSRRGGRN